MGWFNKSRGKPGGSPAPEGVVGGRIPLNVEIVDAWMEAADNRPSATIPSVFDLNALIDVIEAYSPVEAHAARRQLKWLVAKAAPRYLGIEWEHPWQQ